MRAILAALLLCFFAMSSGAEAHARHHQGHHHVVRIAKAVHDQWSNDWPRADFFGSPAGMPAYVETGEQRGAEHQSRKEYSASGDIGSNVAAAISRRLAWCGAYMADKLGIHGSRGRELWVAANWAHEGHATSPHVGAVVVWNHHVGQIVGGEPGNWIINSGNDGHAVRTRARSIAGAIAIRDVSGSRYAGI